MEKEAPGEIRVATGTIYLLFEMNTYPFHRSYLAIDLAKKQIRIVSW